MDGLPRQNTLGPAARLTMARRADAAGAAAAPRAATPGEKRIGLADRALMIGVALAFDGLQAILALFVVGVALASAVSIVAWLTFFLWFKMKGVSFGLPGGTGLPSGNRPLVALAAGLGVEIVPFANVLPSWTVAVAIASFSA